MNWKTLVATAALSSIPMVGCSPTTSTPMNCGNGMCDMGETTASCAADCPAPVTRTYVVSTIDTSTPPGGTMAYGFDLDGMDGGAAGQACTAAPDFVSSVTGDGGVDNQLSTVLPTLDSMIMGGVNGAIQEQIQSGALLLVFEVSDINSFSSDANVMVHVALGAAAGGTPMVEGTGLAADQTFTEMMDLGTVSGSITGGRLHAETSTLPLMFTIMDAPITLSLHDVVIGGRISDAGGLTEGEFGAVVAVDDVVNLAMMFLMGVDRMTVEALAMPDISPDATGDHCNSISAGLGFTSVAATLE